MRHCGQLDAGRRRVYRCIEAMVKLEEDTDKDGETRDLTGFLPALKAMFGEDTLTRAEALLAGELRFFGQPSPGLDLEGCDLIHPLSRCCHFHPPAADDRPWRSLLLVSPEPKAENPQSRRPELPRSDSRVNARGCANRAGTALGICARRAGVQAREVA